MITRTAVPSPKGSNLERLYFTKQPIALDAAPDDSNSKITALAVLVAQLDPDEKAMLLQMLQPADTSTDPDDDSPAMDSAGRTLDDRLLAGGYISFSEYIRRKSYSGGAKPNPDAVMRADPDYGKSFEERFPNAKRLLNR